MVSPGGYGVTPDELRTLMEYRGSEAKEKIDADYGGVNGLCERLKTDPNTGVPNTQQELDIRRAIFGANEIPPHPLPSKRCRQLVCKALPYVAGILLVCALVLIALSVYRTEDGFRWLGFAKMVIVVVLVLGYFTQKITEKMRNPDLPMKIDKAEQMFSVIRGGESIQIAVKELVVGDVAHIQKGDLLPVDGILIQSNDLKIDESSLTGESDQIKKSPEHDPIILSGTQVMEGSGKMLIAAVGPNSQSGIVITILGPAYNIAEEEGKAAKREDGKVAVVMEEEPLNK